MEAMDTVKPEIARLFAAKEARRHKLAALPFPEKVRAVVCLQEMAAPVLRARGRKVRVWKLDEPCELFGRGTQKSPSGFITFIRGFRNDRENFWKDVVGAGTNPSLQLNPVAFECFENLVSETGILSRMVL